MFRRKTEFDDILERYMPRSSNHEVESARDRFLVALNQRHKLQQAIDNFKLESRVSMTETQYFTLGYIDQLTLMLVHRMRGEGSSFAIAEEIDNFTGKRIDTGSVFLSLDRMERGGLISSRQVKPEKEGGVIRVLFSLTPRGEQMLKEVRAGAQKLLDALADFA